MITIENKVKVKYKIKNNNTDDNPVFLAIKNQKNANMSSARNLMLTEATVCMVWLAGSLRSPLKNMISISSVIMVKTADAKLMLL